MMAHHQSQIARGFPPVFLLRDTAVRSASSPGRTATFHHEEQGSTDTALGRRLGMCRSTRALRTTGRFGGLGCFLPKLGRCLGIGRSLNRRGIGRPGKAALIAIIHNAADHSGNDAVKPLESHFEISVSASSFNASRIAQKRRQGLAKVGRELVNFRQGGPIHD